MKALSANTRQILEQQIEKSKRALPISTQIILSKALLQDISLEQKFKNLQDPLSFIHTKQIEKLINETQKTSQKLRRQMQQIMQFSKSTYKKIISRQNNQYSFQPSQLQKMNNQTNHTQIQIQLSLKHKQKKSKHYNDSNSKPAINIPLQQNNKEIIRQMKSKKLYRHKLHDDKKVYNHQDQQNDTDLTYQHIKQIDTPHFQQRFKHIDHFQLIRINNTQTYYLKNQAFDIDNNPVIEKAFQRLQFNFIEQGLQYGPLSDTLFFDFQENFQFWKQKLGQGPADQSTNKKVSQQKILSICQKFDIKKPKVKNLCDFAMKKMTAKMLNQYLMIKDGHETKLQMDRRNQNLDDKYNQLKKEFDFAREMKLKAKTQRIPLKFIDTQSQTINRMKQKDFDNHFMQQIPIILSKLGKLNKIREKSMQSKQTSSKLVIMKNICLQIKELLFKLLILMLKGERFFPTNSQDKAQAPYFTYSDVLDVQSRDQVQKKILELIYTRIQEFTVEMVDGVPKTQIIQVYIQERQKNNKVLQIIHSQ